MNQSFRRVTNIHDHSAAQILLACFLWTLGGTPLLAMPPKAAPEQGQQQKADA